jgi:amidase
VIEPDDASALAGQIRAGKTTARVVVERALERAQNCAELGAVRFIDTALAFQQAEAIDAGLMHRRDRFFGLPFVGVPFLMKDLGAEAEGLPLTCGSALFAGAPSAICDSDLARRFRGAGLNPFGVTTSPEFGLSLASEPRVGPLARNPLDRDRTPGGSSGGAAAAVAAGIVAIAHATDAGGSIRVPAACCGLIGLKPTRGATPGGPRFDNYLGGLAVEFVVARSLRDVAVALGSVAGAANGPTPDPDYGRPLFDPLAERMDPLRVGVCLEDGAGFTVVEDRRAALRQAAEVLARQGHRIVPISPLSLDPLLADASFVFDRMVSAYLAAALGRLDVSGLAQLEPLTCAVIARGSALTATDLVMAEHKLAMTAHAMWRFFDIVDVLLTPMLTTPPPLLGSFPTDDGNVEAQWRRMHAFAPYASIANVAGVPALTIPHGVDESGLPLPVQLIGPMGSDGLLLRLAHNLQEAQPWRFETSVAGLVPS